MSTEGFAVISVLATLLSPLIAIQVSQWLERKRARKAEQMRVFQTLMSTRAATLDPRHVEALNSIDVVFGGAVKGETVIRRQWKRYLDHLNTGPATEEWVRRGGELLVDMLDPMATYLGFDIDKTHLKNQTYLPQGHATIENETGLIRSGLVELLSGERALAVAIIPNEREEEEGEEDIPVALPPKSSRGNRARRDDA
jgi:hypothetical protein